MTHYSIAGIDMTIERLHQVGGVRGNAPERFELRNCEWTADVESWSGVPGIVARFRHGNQPKYEHDLRQVWPFLVLAFAEPEPYTRVLHAISEPAVFNARASTSAPMVD